MSTAWVNGVGPAAVPNHTPWDFAKFSHREVAQLAARLVAKSGNDPDYLLDAGKVFATATVPGWRVTT